MAEAELARRAEGFVGINGVNVWGDIKKYVEDIEFTEVASGETDSFDIALIDSDKHFINDWIVDKGTRLDAKIQLFNWRSAGDEQWIDCGEFLVDRIKIRAYPVRVSIQSLALPLNGTKNTKKWEKISIRAIAKDICKWIGCELVYYADDVTLESRQQSRQTDIDFLYSLCKEYGFGMKVYRNKIVIFNRERQDAADVVNTVNIDDIAENYDIDDNEEGTYTGVKCTYKPEGSDKELTYTYGSSKRMINLDVSATSAHEAELKGKAALYDANIEAVKLKFTALGGFAPIYVGTNYYFTGLGGYSGKYAIDKVTHTLSGKNSYRISVVAHAIELEKDRTNTGNTAADTSEITAGKKVELNNCPLYMSYDATKPVRHITGTYYLYDGKRFGDRYRICNANEVGAKPINANVTGYIDGNYI